MDAWIKVSAADKESLLLQGCRYVKMEIRVDSQAEVCLILMRDLGPITIMSELLQLSWRKREFASLTIIMVVIISCSCSTDCVKSLFLGRRGPQFV